MTTARNAAASSRRPKVRGTSKPRRATLRGHGDYSEDVKNETDVARRLEKKIDHLEKSLVHATPGIGGAASMAGRALGSVIGQGDLGAFAGAQLAKLFGHGDYSTSIKGNSLMAGVAGNAVPKFQGDGKRGVRLTEREFLGNVVAGNLVSSSTVFTNTAYTLNPTDPTTFPWLSKIATLFDQWEPHGIVFEFHTTSSTFNGTSQALGAVVMATDYDYLDSTYGSKQQMENADYACSSVPSNNLLHGIECDPRERPIEVLYTAIRPSNPNFSNLGKFQIATQGMSVANVVVGELWVSYDITFYKKQLSSSTLNLASISGTSNAQIGGPLWIPSSIYTQNNITYTQVVGTGTDFFFPPSMGSGNYFSFEVINGNTQTGDSASCTPVGTNCTVLVNASTVTVGGTEIVSGIITLTAPSAKIRFGLKNTVAGPITLSILEVPPNWVV
nr:MAG: putative capsid protein [Narnaviridae sp.]